MRYMMLIYGNEKAESTLSKEEEAAVYGEYMKFNEEVRARGLELTGDALQPTTTATTVRVRDGKMVTTDGPFAETKEQLGGFYIVSCKDLDEALAIAAKIPGARHGSVEVRPVVEF